MKQILEFLEKSGLEENTIIVFTSDNGPENSWKGRIDEFGHHSNYIYRGGKRDIYEGGHRVPFFVRWPAGIIQPGRSWDKIVGQVDLLATFAEIIGVELPENAGEDSQSFAPVLFNKIEEYQRLPLINHSASGRFAITEGNWKLILPEGEIGIELYNLSDDPSEKRNVAELHPEIVKKLKEKVTDIVCNGRTTLGESQQNDTGYWNHLTWMSKEEYYKHQ